MVSSMMDISVVCLDYYMTLVELEAPFQQIAKWMKKYLKDAYPEVDVQRFNSRFTRARAKLGTGERFFLGIELLSESLAMVCKDFGLPCFSKEFEPFAKALFSTPKAYTDAHQLLEVLRGKYRVGLLTNADNHIIRTSIELQGFQFDFVITSEDAKANKPSPNMFQYALDKLERRKEEILMIGDSQIDDIYGAGRMGINTVWVNRNRESLKEGIVPPVFEVDKLSDIPKKLF